MTDISRITEELIAGNSETVCDIVKELLGAGMNADEILNEGLIQGMDIVGGKMQDGTMFIPEVLMAAQCMSHAVEILKPLLSDEGASSVGRIVIGTVKGDLHDIGKNLVVMMLESAGFEVTDLGVDVPPEQFVTAIRENDAAIVAISALLTTTMPMMKNTIDAVVESGLRDQVRIIVGGAPVTEAFAGEIGADGFAPDAGSAAGLAKTLVA